MGFRLRFLCPPPWSVVFLGLTGRVWGGMPRGGGGVRLAQCLKVGHEISLRCCNTVQYLFTVNGDCVLPSAKQTCQYSPQMQHDMSLWI